ncbi:MAG TPA: OsmC family protein [Caldilineaceae bacterium]|nr:OsmC family protein [Caldilineaceae bacterium]
MTSSAPTYIVRSTSSPQAGRSLNMIRQQQLVIDSPQLNGAISPGEAFLAGISACGVTLLGAVAPQLGIQLDHVDVQIEGYMQSGVAAFDHIDLHFTLTGPTDEEAAILVGRYQDG